MDMSVVPEAKSGPRSTYSITPYSSSYPYPEAEEEVAKGLPEVGLTHCANESRIW